MAPGIITVKITTRADLYSAYMPFLQNGGIFIQTNRFYKLGDEVFLLLTLMDESETELVPSSVVWVTPHMALGNRPQGVGVQFAEKDSVLRSKIEHYLRDYPEFNRLTDTM